MQENFSFIVWACKLGVINIKSGPFLLHMPPDQAVALARAMTEAAQSLAPNDHQEPKARLAAVRQLKPLR